MILTGFRKEITLLSSTLGYIPFQCLHFLCLPFPWVVVLLKVAATASLLLYSRAVIAERWM